MNKFFKWNMFVTALLPLWVSIIFKNLWDFFDHYNKDKFFTLEINFVIVILILCLFSCFSMISFLRYKKKDKNLKEGIVKKAKLENKLSSEFLLFYILPMIVFDYSKLRDVFLFCLIFLTLAFLCIRNNNIYTNILLEILGYKIYKADVGISVLDKKEINKDMLIISGKNIVLSIDNVIEFLDFENDIYIVFK